MTIIITDADDAIYMTKAEHKYWEEMYYHTFRNYFGAAPTLEEFIRQQKKKRLSLLLPKNQ